VLVTTLLHSTAASAVSSVTRRTAALCTNYCRCYRCCIHAVLPPQQQWLILILCPFLLLFALSCRYVQARQEVCELYCSFTICSVCCVSMTRRTAALCTNYCRCYRCCIHAVLPPQQQWLILILCPFLLLFALSCRYVQARQEVCELYCSFTICSVCCVSSVYRLLCM
jgi:hypothetical protein